MAKTKRTTKQRLIEAACEVFSEKGYRDATIADICTHSDCNIAAVNYHFGDKENLYAHAWRYAFEQSLRAYPPEGDLDEHAPAEQRLRARINSLINRILDEGKVGYFSRMLFAEMATPTNSIDDVVEQTVMPQKEKMLNILTKLLGDAASDKNVALCGVSIMNMCIMFAMHSRLREKMFMPKGGLDISKDQLVDHLYTFAMGGIAKCREQHTKEQEDA